MENIDSELELEENKIIPIKAFFYKSFICYLTITIMPLNVRDGSDTTTGYIILKYLNNNEYMHMEEVIEKIIVDKKQNKDEDFFNQVPQLGRDEDITINKKELIFYSYCSFWNSTSAPRNPKKYVAEQLKEIIDLYYAQIN